MIDRKEITPRIVRRQGGTVARRLGVPELVYLALRPKLTGILSARSRRRVYQGIKQEITRRTLDETVVLSGSFEMETPLQPTRIELDVVTINYDEALGRVLERMRLLTAAEQSVVSDPDIRGGEPVVRGTRVPVYRLADLAAQGLAEDEVLEDHPAVSREALRAALTYARAHPRRGRPKRGPWHQGNVEEASTGPGDGRAA
jgi:uncharacterized protein (DUF433 family)